MLRTGSLLLATLVCLSLTTAYAAKPAKPLPPGGATSVAEAGPDFEIQGEYLGDITVDGQAVAHGVQVIALGHDKFHAVSFAGGLPGDGWDKSPAVEADGEAKDGTAVFQGPHGVTATISGGQLKIVDADGTALGTLKKVHRKSPTEGAKPPAGAIVLFDGTTPDNFEGGRMTKEGILTEGATSKQKFQSYSIHLEFIIPFMPDARGQGRGNSGYYSQGRYEVQILDSFGLQAKNNDCGGIYTVKEPLVNMCYPPLSWQTYDVDYTAAEYKDGKKVKNARITARHNGVLIQKDCEVPHATTAAPVAEGPQPGPVFLQNHGNAVRFRNIWVVEKK